MSDGRPQSGQARGSSSSKKKGGGRGRGGRGRGQGQKRNQKKQAKPRQPQQQQHQQQQQPPGLAPLPPLDASLPSIPPLGGFEQFDSGSGSGSSMPMAMNTFAAPYVPSGGPHGQQQPGPAAADARPQRKPRESRRGQQHGSPRRQRGGDEEGARGRGRGRDKGRGRGRGKGRGGGQGHHRERRDRHSSPPQRGPDYVPHHLDDAPYQYHLPKAEVEGQKTASDLREESIDASVDAGMLCGVCFELMGIRMLGKCDHPLCYVCGLRLRALWKNNACAICRTDLPKVILTDSVNRAFAEEEKANLKYNRRLKAYVTSPQVEQQCLQLFDLQCKVCGQKFREPYMLRDHVKKEHHLHYCPLCVGNAHKFYFELDLYTHKELELHKQRGDNEGFKGHPMCKFCDKHFYDNDALYRHLRETHEHCQLCANLGKHHEYYNNRRALAHHYEKEHFTCPHCEVTDMVAFEDEVSLQKHITSAHPGRAPTGKRQLLTLSHPSYSDRNTRGGRGGSGGGGGGGGGRRGRRGRRFHGDDDDDDDNDTRFAVTQQAPQMHEEPQQPIRMAEFPSLGEDIAQSAPQPPSSSSSSSAPGHARRSQQHQQQQQLPRQQQQQQQQRPSWQTQRQSGAGAPSNFATRVSRSAEDNALENLGGPRPVQPKTASWVAKTAATPGAGRDVNASRSSTLGLTEYKYIKPADFKARNAKMGRTLQQVLTSTEYQEFLSLSAAFRHEHISAFEYARRCRELLGSHFENVYSELVALFPDLAVQAHMVEAWQRLHAPTPKLKAGRGGKKSGASARARTAKRSNPLWSRCQFCQQVLSPDDVAAHESNHDIAQEEEFPSLMRVPKHKTKKPAAGAWRK